MKYILILSPSGKTHDDFSFDAEGQVHTYYFNPNLSALFMLRGISFSKIIVNEPHKIEDYSYIKTYYILPHISWGNSIFIENSSVKKFNDKLDKIIND